MRDEPRELPGPEDLCLLNEQQAEEFFGPAWRLNSREQTVRFGDITAIASPFPRSWLEQVKAIQQRLLEQGRDPLFPNTLLFLCPAPGRQPIMSDGKGSAAWWDREAILANTPFPQEMPRHWRQYDARNLKSMGYTVEQVQAADGATNSPWVQVSSPNFPAGCSGMAPTAQEAAWRLSEDYAACLRFFTQHGLEHNPTPGEAMTFRLPIWWPAVRDHLIAKGEESMRAWEDWLASYQPKIDEWIAMILEHLHIPQDQPTPEQREELVALLRTIIEYVDMEEGEGRD